MTGNIEYSSQVRTALARNWDAQAAELRALESKLSSAPTGGLPPSAQGAARTFLAMWQRTASKARIASEVYADELFETGVAFEDLEAEITRRLDAVNAGL